ncbi:TetR/AcrR family transcriptional regulator [Rhodococcus tukisamuensis]|uniref:DNA-binding transcriptional regulator, AcrR family n=1 Tax=Rhodococcus tukisamuensis TaxID=168276 RepID=A0A1G7EWX8_9NOCA|nr:TetR/AcrR family transcriptional regulator [Rhodococcus tukisamuensis]SDE68159.1 DNA-binding transcriptional regulator, AcrR family [Rhodococcus tukisamuensis]
MTPGPAPAASLDESVAALFPDVTSDVARRLIASAVDCFATRGYHGTTTRDISEGAGLSPAALYVHFSTKEQVLFQCSLVGHQGVLTAIRAAVSEHTAPADRLRELVRAFTLWHARYHTMCRVAQYELSALTPEHHETVAVIRRDTERFVREEIQRGVDSGDFVVPEVSSAALAILSMGIDVARWFQPGRADPATLADHYAALATAMVTGT